MISRNRVKVKEFKMNFHNLDYIQIDAFCMSISVGIIQFM